LIGRRDAVAREVVAAADVADPSLDCLGHDGRRLMNGSRLIGRRHLNHIGYG
jgi:hypothetical protein